MNQPLSSTPKPNYLKNGVRRIHGDNNKADAKSEISIVSEEFESFHELDISQIDPPPLNNRCNTNDDSRDLSPNTSHQRSDDKNQISVVSCENFKEPDSKSVILCCSADEPEDYQVDLCPRQWFDCRNGFCDALWRFIIVIFCFPLCYPCYLTRSIRRRSKKILDITPQQSTTNDRSHAHDTITITVSKAHKSKNYVA